MNYDQKKFLVDSRKTFFRVMEEKAHILDFTEMKKTWTTHVVCFKSVILKGDKIGRSYLTLPLIKPFTGLLSKPDLFTPVYMDVCCTKEAFCV